MDFFRGFVKTKNKKCVDKFKGVPDHELRSYEEVKNLSEFAGILADDTVLIDIDDMEQSEILLSIVIELQLHCRVLQSRSGMHFLFKNDGKFKTCKTKTTLANGLKNIDIKVGSSNSYEVLKIDGKEREILYDIQPEEEYQFAPKWLVPIKTNIDFQELGEGDGRNQALFNYELTLQSNDFSVEEAKECIEIINRFILMDSMSEGEIETITRDAAFLKPVFFNKGVFQHDKFGNYMISKNHIKRINGQIHIYKNGCYVSGCRYIENEMISEIPSIKSNQRSEVLKYIDVKITEESRIDHYLNYICFRNGLYNLVNNELMSFTPNIIVTNKIPWDYSPNAYDETTDKTLNRISCNDKNIRMLLEEIIGYCFYRSTKYSKAFILTGSGSNGKSTYLETIKCLLGADNVSQLDLSELSDRFNTVTMASKLANIGDDINEDELDVKTMSVFKKLVTGNGLKAENKGQDVFFFKPSVKLLFSANEIPRMKSKGFSAIKRRLLLVPFNARFTKDSPDFDRNIEYKLRSQNAMEYLIRIGIEGLNRLMNNNGFTESSKIEEEIKRFERDNNPIISWLDSLEDESILVREDVSTLHLLFTRYCYECGFRVFDVREFSKQIQAVKGFVTDRRTVNKKKMTFYTKSL